MKEIKKEKLIPELRFKEFKEEWENISLGKIVTGISSGKSHLSDNGKYPLYGSTGNIGKTNGNTYTGESILVARVGANAGLIYMVQGTYGVTDNTLVLRTMHNTEISFLRNSLLRSNLSRLVFGSGQPLITGSDLKKLKLYLPSLPEQQKISSFLSLIDKKIELLNKKKELLEIYKKGIMHNIFNRDIRFKDSNGNDYPEWEEKRLGEIGEFYRGHTYSAKDVDPEGSLLVLRSSNIQDNKLDIYNNLQFVNKGCNSNILLKSNDIVICMSNGSKELVGKTGEYLGDYKNKLTVGAFCSIFRSTYKLSKYLFKTIKYKKYMHLMLAGTNINNLNNTEMGNLIFPIPTDNEESEKINTFLSKIFYAYEQNLSKINMLARFKQSLLQKMFI